MTCLCHAPSSLSKRCFCLAANKGHFETCSQTKREGGRLCTSFVSTFASRALSLEGCAQWVELQWAFRGMLISGGGGCPPCPLGLQWPKRCGWQFPEFKFKFTFKNYSSVDSMQSFRHIPWPLPLFWPSSTFEVVGDPVGEVFALSCWAWFNSNLYSCLQQIPLGFIN